jgi:NAD(P)H-dependent FMN reductase
MPLFDEDLEAETGLHPHAIAFKNLLLTHQGLLIASPEYNGSYSAVLKNAIDWASRPLPNQPPVSVFQDKVAAIMSASPGALGGLRGLVHIRTLLENLKVLVIPEQVAISRAYEAFNVDGTLKDPKQHNSIENLGSNLSKLLIKLH